MKKRQKEKVLIYKKEKIVFSFVSVVFMLYALTLILPFVYILINSFKNNGEFINDIWALPSKLNFDNYAYVFREYNIGEMFVNNIVFTFLGTVVAVLSGTVVAYVLAKYKFTGSSAIYTTFIVLMLIPGIGTMAASYRLMLDLHFYDSWVGVTIMQASPVGMTFLLMYGFFKNISWNYAEAAQIDGAGHFTIFFRIMLPQGLAGILAVTYMTALGKWNDYTTPYLYLPHYKTLATGLQSLSVNASSSGAYVQMYAAMIISILPVLLMFIILKDFIMNNTVAGGLKG